MVDLNALIVQAAHTYQLDPDMFRRQLHAESGLNPNVVNPSGAAGIAQFMPGTARAFGINPLDPTQAIPAAASYMRNNLNRFGGDIRAALAAYNWGPGNVAKHGIDNLPPETRNYVAKITTGTPIPPMSEGSGGTQDTPLPEGPTMTSLPPLPTQAISPSSSPPPPTPTNSLADMLTAIGQRTRQAVGF